MTCFEPQLPSNHPRLTLLLLRLLEDLLDNLLLLNEESTDNAVLDAVGASRTTVGALDGLLGAGDGGVFAGAERRDTGELGAAVLSSVSAGLRHAGALHTYTALGSSALLLDVKVTELTTGSLDHADLLAPGVVGGTTPLPAVSHYPACVQAVPSLIFSLGSSVCDVRR